MFPLSNIVLLNLCPLPLLFREMCVCVYVSARVCACVCVPLSPISVAPMSLGVELTTGAWATCQRTSPWLSLMQSTCRTLRALLLYMMNYWLCVSHFFLRILWYDIFACLEDSKFCSSLYSSLTFTAILAPLSWIRDCVIDAPLEDEPFQVIDSLHFD